MNDSIDNAHSASIAEKQATLNIGTIGHVAHGKSTVVKALTSTKTIRFRLEAIKNSTIKLGYANAKIFRCPTCPSPACFQPFPSSAQTPVCKACGDTLLLQRHVSFVDCPGHDILMATMLNGAAVMDAALLLVAANESCPQPQTLEHLAAVQIAGLEHVLVLQNKIDLVKKKDALEQHTAIRTFVQGTSAAAAPVLPVSAQLKLNMDAVCEYLCRLPLAERDLISPPLMIFIRSFDVNKPGMDAEKLLGGVAGGSLLRGVLRVGDQVEIRPGVVSLRQGNSEKKGKFRCKQLFATVQSLKAESNALNTAVPGGLVAVGTDIDPVLLRSDRLVGQVLGLRGQMPAVYVTLVVEYYLLSKLFGNRESDKGRKNKVERIDLGEVLLFNVGSMCTGGKVVIKNTEEKNKCTVELQAPVCTKVGEKIAISRRIDRHWRLIGWGKITGGSQYTYDE